MFANTLRDLKKEKSLFLTCLVTLQITTYVGEKLTVIWKNPKPLSILYHGPLRVKFEKGSIYLILIEKTTLKDEISNGKFISVRHTIQVTMIDDSYCLIKCTKFQSMHG